MRGEYIKMRRSLAVVVSVICLIGSGCAVHFSKRSPWDIQQLQELSDELEQFKTLARLKAEEADELRRAKALLEERLSASDISVGYDERGLVTRLLDRVLFDSGSSKLRQTKPLDKVAEVFKQMPNQPLGIEGHTDNVPIKHSGWESNKALSLARAQAVADHLRENHNIPESRLTVIGYGEEHPIASNDTAAGRRQNRRVEIILLPQGGSDAYKTEAQRVSSGLNGYVK